jgi:GH24 family phage-related lysozyme (muramidase)
MTNTGIDREIAFLREQIRSDWAERSECTDLKGGREIRLRLVRRRERLSALLHARERRSLY